MLVAEKKTEDAKKTLGECDFAVLLVLKPFDSIWLYLIPVDEIQHVRLVYWESFELKLVFPSCSHFCFASGHLFQTGYAIAGTGPGRDLLAGVTRATGHLWGSLIGSRQVCGHKLNSNPEKNKQRPSSVHCGASTWSQFGGLRRLHTVFFHDRCSQRKSWGCRTLNIWTCPFS